MTDQGPQRSAPAIRRWVPPGVAELGALLPGYEVLALLGRLTFHHSGRDYRLTDVFGKVVKEILA